MTINELPVGWVKCKVKDLCSISTGKLDANAAKDDGDYPFFTCALKPSKIDTYVFDGKCVYVPGNGANVGFVGYYEGKFNAYQRTYVLHDIGIHEKYLYYGLLLNWNHYNKDKQFGVATNFIRLANLEEYPINLPPLAEQKRIVGKIEELFAEVDKGIDLLKQKQAELKKYRQSVLSAAFSGKLYKTTDWQEVILGHVCEKVRKRSETKDETEKFKYIDISSINNKTMQIETPVLTNGKEAPSRARQIVRTGDVVFSTVRTYLMNIGYVSEELDNQIASTGFCVIRGKEGLLDGKFMFYKSISKEFLNPLNQMQYGAVYPAVRDKDVFAQNILLPTLPEQEQIVAEIEQRFEKADILEKSIENALESAEKLKQSILKKAFEGKLVPQDPNDEPASILLERIKSEQTPKKGKKK